MKELNLNQGFIITQNEEEEIKIESNKLIIAPIGLFLLSTETFLENHL